MTYLILHKVRGEPAFDVAEKIMIGDEEGWIIPTSGHRAYPYWNIELGDPSYIEGMTLHVPQLPPVPADWPDHYEVKAAPPPNFNIMAAINGLMPKLNRRF